MYMYTYMYVKGQFLHKKELTLYAVQHRYMYCTIWFLEYNLEQEFLKYTHILFSHTTIETIYSDCAVGQETYKAQW